MLEQVGLVRAASTPGGRCRSRCPSLRRRGRADRPVPRPLRAGGASRADRLVRFAESRTCRHRQVAEHFGETLADDCGMCDVCSPLAPSADTPAAAAPPSGRHRGRDPRSRARTAVAARTHRADCDAARLDERAALCPALSEFGLLAAASQADVKRWLQLLELSGALEAFESEDGFRLLRAVPGVELPRSAARPPPGTADEGLFERLRAWRLERARADEVPAYVVLHDATLRELATAKPANGRDLAAVKGRADQARALRRRRARRHRSRLGGLGGARPSRRAPPRQALLPLSRATMHPLRVFSRKIVLGRVAESASCASLRSSPSS